MDVKLLILAIAPAIALILFIYRKDRYEREHGTLLCGVFVLGALSTIPISVVEGFLLKFNFFSGYASVFYLSFVVAGWTEESFKRFVVLKSVFWNEHFNQKMDGIIYSVMTSLGFATVENILYVAVDFKDAFAVGIGRAILSVPAHMLFGVSMGYYLSQSKYGCSEKERRKGKLHSLWIPVLLHGSFNFMVSSENRLFILLFIPYIFYLWRFNLKKIKIYREESKKGN